ncbi:site-specific DNA-methyltransferase [Ruegeria sp. HKCCD7221]|uniref:site-specific DNA-methyltransferase n=1 Tax=Ruegeria sp. HKCCD7221 TaxID=2683009 RepID=UPI00148A078B|nr:site-specific DNA-methyltransferase [Ruegeria sp. HKCCD7221]
MTDKTTPVETHIHDNTRTNIPTAELEGVVPPEDVAPIKVAYERRNRDLDPQLIWRGKDLDQEELIADAPPIYLQEQIHPKALIEDLRSGRKQADDLFGHFGLDEEDLEAEVEFYRHNRKWSNRMILGDGLQVMSSLSAREDLRGKVQMIYIDPPYGIKFNSNFQWSTTSRDVKDGKLNHLTREPEQVKAFRDTWRDGIHSYLSYLRDRLVVARDLLTESGSCFVQIGDENVHRVRALMDEVFGEENFVSQIYFKKTSGAGSPGELTSLAAVSDYLIWFAKDFSKKKFRPVLGLKQVGGDGSSAYRLIKKNDGEIVSGFNGDLDNLHKDLHDRICRVDNITSQSGVDKTRYPVWVSGQVFRPNRGVWKTGETGMKRLLAADRVHPGKTSIGYIRFFNDFAAIRKTNSWDDTSISGSSSKTYVVQTSEKVVQRCLLMTTDPGDLVLDPTCGSGTTAYVAEQWGRRWITIDTSRVALALARARIMGAKYPYYLLADSEAGQKKEGEITRTPPRDAPTHSDIRAGFVYQRVPHITLKSIANNAEIDEIWEQRQPAVEAARAALNAALKGNPTPFTVETGGRKGQKIDFTATGEVELPSGEMTPANGFMEWEIPRDSVEGWPDAAKDALADFWTARVERQNEIDASIAAKAAFEYLYDRPYEDKKRIRVAGPFTVESLSPHRTAAVDQNGELIDEVIAAKGDRLPEEQEVENFQKSVMENLAKAGVHQAGKEDRIAFDALTAWPGEWIAAEGTYMEGDIQRRAGIFLGPEYGTVARADLVAAAREASDAGFDVLIACAFNFEAHAQDFRKLGRIPILQARMNPDLHMADDLKAGGGNLFVVFGEPDIEVIEEGDRVRVNLLGVDIFKPAKGIVESSDAKDIACWFIDTDYSGESFFVRQAYFPGADVPYKQLKSTLKGEIDEEAWESLKLTKSRPFARPKSGRIAVKVINHLGDEVMKVFGV